MFRFGGEANPDYLSPMNDALAQQQAAAFAAAQQQAGGYNPYFMQGTTHTRSLFSPSLPAIRSSSDYNPAPPISLCTLLPNLPHTRLLPTSSTPRPTSFKFKFSTEFRRIHRLRGRPLPRRPGRRLPAAAAVRAAAAAGYPAATSPGTAAGAVLSGAATDAGASRPVSSAAAVQPHAAE